MGEAVKPDKYITDAEILNRVAHHPPSSPDIIGAHEEIRRHYGTLAVRMNNLLPEGPLKTTAINNLLRAMQDANTCVAVQQKVMRKPEQITPKDLVCEQCGQPVELVLISAEGGPFYKHVMEPLTQHVVAVQP